MISSIETWYFSFFVSQVSGSVTSQSFHSLSISKRQASITSQRLCGAIFVAIPTAIHIVPLHKWFGNFVGKTIGSFNVPSKLSLQSIVSWSISAVISSANFVNLASVYLMAAAQSQSILPKFHCPSTKGYLIDHGWASLTIAS